MRIGILKETKVPADRRVPISPVHCRQAENEYPGLRIVVQPSDTRCFTDQEYKREGIELSHDLRSCDIILGVKEVNPANLLPDHTYFFFSHTIKKQPHNKGLLQAVLDKRIRLVDYEVLADSKGIRIIGFGRWAGLVGTYYGLLAWCMRQGAGYLRPLEAFRDLNDMIARAVALKPGPVRIALTGDGRVAGGAEEMLTAAGIKKVTVIEYMNHGDFDLPVYVQLDPSKYNRNLNGDFDLQHFFSFPDTYGSDFARYCDKTDLLVMAAYWDHRAPVLFTADDMRKKDFRIRVIADISCDIRGPIPSSLRTTTFANPYFDYNPVSGTEANPFSNPAHITMMTIDNLPCGLPREASADFGGSIKKNVIPILLGKDPENILERATIAKAGKLTDRYRYLEEWVYNK